MTTYPQTIDTQNIKRRFSANYFTRITKNSEKFSRHWLVYSKSTDSVFCFVCKLFSTETCPGKIATTGINDWGNIGKRINSHERDIGHLNCVKLFNDAKKAIELSNTIEDHQLRLHNADYKYWKDIFFRLFTNIKFLAKSNIAFRGINCAPLQPHNGNYLQLIEHVASYDSYLQTHLNKYQQNSNFKHRLSPKYQNLMINFLASKVNEIIVSNLCQAKYYGIIVDATPDISKIEQFSFVARFVRILSNKYANKTVKSVKISEHFLGFVDLSNTTGEAIANEIKQFLHEKTIPFENMRSQSYDNGSNMSGRYHGCQSWILNENPRAPYAPCTTHSLNLVVNDIVNESSQGIHFFFAVANLYSFFQSSTARWEILKKHTKITLKRFSDTRWASRISAIIPLMLNLKGIIAALNEINENEKNKLTKTAIAGIIKQITNFQFLCSLVVWFHVLEKINKTSELLQSPEIELSEAITDLHNTIIDVQSFLLDQEKIFTQASNIANEIGVSNEFQQKRNQRDQKTKFIEEFLHPVLDRILDSCNDRFSALEKLNERFSFFHKLSNLQELSDKEIREKCNDLADFYTMNVTENTGIENISKDLDGMALADEILFVKQTFDNFDSAIDLLTLVCDYGEDYLPELYIALRLFLVIPVTVASAERSFSKLKLIKNYLRSTMSQTRLNSLATISIEHEIVDSIDIEQLVEDFMKIRGFRKF